jgi:hypothetical protein
VAISVCDSIHDGPVHLERTGSAIRWATAGSLGPKETGSRHPLVSAPNRALTISGRQRGQVISCKGTNATQQTSLSTRRSFRVTATNGVSLDAVTDRITITVTKGKVRW